MSRPRGNASCSPGSLPDTRRVALRMAIVIGDGPATRMLLTLARYGSGRDPVRRLVPTASPLSRHRRHTRPASAPRPWYRTGGRQKFSWVHIDDVVAAIRFIRDDDRLIGPINIASPNPSDNRTLMRTLRRVVGARVRAAHDGDGCWRLGMWALRTESELILKSRWVLPGILTDAGFTFAHTDLEARSPRSPQPCHRPPCTQHHREEHAAMSPEAPPGQGRPHPAAHPDSRSRVVSRERLRRDDDPEDRGRARDVGGRDELPLPVEEPPHPGALPRRAGSPPRRRRAAPGRREPASSTDSASSSRPDSTSSRRTTRTPESSSRRRSHRAPRSTRCPPSPPTRSRSSRTSSRRRSTVPRRGGVPDDIRTLLPARARPRPPAARAVLGVRHLRGSASHPALLDRGLKLLGSVLPLARLPDAPRRPPRHARPRQRRARMTTR